MIDWKIFLQRRILSSFSRRCWKKRRRGWLPGHSSRLNYCSNIVLNFIVSDKFLTLINNFLFRLICHMNTIAPYPAKTRQNPPNQTNMHHVPKIQRFLDLIIHLWNPVNKEAPVNAPKTCQKCRWLKIGKDSLIWSSITEYLFEQRS